jgi:hypothetical protein
MNYVTQKNMKDILDGIKGKVPMGQFVSTQTASDSPLGTIIAYMGITPPDGFLACDGSTYNIADYTALATHIMNEFGSYNYFGGNGTTTFAVPDLRGEFLRGTGTNSHTNQGSGANVGVHQDGTEHTGNMFDKGTGASCVPYDGGTSSWVYPTKPDKVLSSSSGSAWSNKSGNGGGSQVINFTSRPTNTSVLYCIKYTSGVSTQYSTTEQAVGTWIDGKTIYQKTFTGGSITSGMTSTVILDTLSYVDTIIEINGMLNDGLPTQTYFDNSQFCNLWFRNSSKELCIRAGSNYVGATLTYTLKYTKV